MHRNFYIQYICYSIENLIAKSLKEGREDMAYIEFKNVCKEYKMGKNIIKALDNTNFSIEKGELVVVVGP